MRVSVFWCNIALAITLISCHPQKEKENDAPASNSTDIIDDSISKRAAVNTEAAKDSLIQFEALYVQYSGRYQFNSIKGSKTAIFNYLHSNKIKFELFTSTSYVNSETAEGIVTMTSANNGYYIEPKRYRLDFIFSDSAIMVHEKRDTAYTMHPDLTFDGVYDKIILTR